MHNGVGFVNFRTREAVSSLNACNLHFADGSIVSVTSATGVTPDLLSPDAL